MKTLVLVILCIVMLFFAVGAFYLAVKEKKEKKQMEEHYKNVISEHLKEDKEKEKLEQKISGTNHTDNIVNSLDLLRNNSKGK